MALASSNSMPLPFRCHATTHCCTRRRTLKSLHKTRAQHTIEKKRKESPTLLPVVARSSARHQKGNTQGKISRQCNDSNWRREKHTNSGTGLIKLCPPSSSSLMSSALTSPPTNMICLATSSNRVTAFAHPPLHRFNNCYYVVDCSIDLLSPIAIIVAIAVIDVYSLDSIRPWEKGFQCRLYDKTLKSCSTELSSSIRQTKTGSVWFISLGQVDWA